MLYKVSKILRRTLAEKIVDDLNSRVDNDLFLKGGYYCIILTDNSGKICQYKQIIEEEIKKNATNLQ